eukprot:m.42098 g.42098  ORF g.42098 m.42098 type:complete len:60 (-) comp16951_c0_seq1:523-702(-)
MDFTGVMSLSNKIYILTGQVFALVSLTTYTKLAVNTQHHKQGGTAAPNIQTSTTQMWLH